jgi:hypothetical protein
MSDVCEKNPNKPNVWFFSLDNGVRDKYISDIYSKESKVKKDNVEDEVCGICASNADTIKSDDKNNKLSKCEFKCSFVSCRKCLDSWHKMQGKIICPQCKQFRKNGSKKYLIDFLLCDIYHFYEINIELGKCIITANFSTECSYDRMYIFKNFCRFFISRFKIPDYMIDSMRLIEDCSEYIKFVVSESICNYVVENNKSFDYNIRDIK